MNRKQRRALTRRDADADNLLKHAVTLTRQNDLAGAANLLSPVAHAPGAPAQVLHLLSVVRLQQGKPEEAFPLLKRATQAEPENPSFWFTLGTAHEAAAAWNDALAAYDRVLALDPNLADAQFNRANSLAKQGLFAEAVEAHRTLVAAHPEHLSGMFHLAHCLVELDQAEDAEATYKSILEKSPKFILAHNGLGNLYKAQGHFKEAQEAFNALLLIRPDFGPAYYSLADMNMLSREAPEVERMERLADREGAETGNAVYYNFALAKIFEDAEDRELSWKRLTKGARMRRELAQFDVDVEITQLEKLMGQAANRDAIPAAPDDRPIFVVGLPRTGSTLTENILSRHSEVSGFGEIPDFNIALRDAVGANSGGSDVVRALAEASDDAYRQMGVDYVKRITARQSDVKRWVDKRLPNVDWVGAILCALPEARVLQCRRNALDTVYACYRMLFRDGHVYTYDLTELARMVVVKNKMMDRWKELWPDRVMDVAYEDLVEDLEGTARAITSFCGLEWDAACLEFQSADSMVKTASAVQVRQPLYTSSIGRWRSYARELAPISDILKDLLSEEDRAALADASAATA